MTISPMRRRGITSNEYDDLKSYMDDGFELTNEHIDNLEKSMIAQFKGVSEQFVGVNKRIDNLENNMSAQFKGVNEQFKGVNEQLAKQKEDITQLTKLVTKIDANTAELTKVVLKIATKVL